MDSKLLQLYQGVILKHNNEPSHFEKRPQAQHVLEAYNPLCGDKFKLFLDIEEGIIRQAHFHGYGCAISKAATSVLIEKIQNQPLSHIQELISEYFNIVENGDKTSDEELSAFSSAKDFAGRKTCATLSWSAMKDFLMK